MRDFNVPAMKPIPKEHRLYNQRQAAEALGVHTNTIRNWLEEGKIRAHKIGTRKYIPWSELERLAGR